MEIRLKRRKESKEFGGYTIGDMYLAGSTIRECYTLEDEKRNVKVRGETRIPAGTYRITYREVLSGKTNQYRAKYPWFKWHLWLRDVPNFEYVYIHVGNVEADTDGCILVGHGVDMSGGKVLSSKAAFESLYKKIAARLDDGEEVTIKIEDE